jgi:hypothetical protein
MRAEFKYTILSRDAQVEFGAGRSSTIPSADIMRMRYEARLSGQWH